MRIQSFEDIQSWQVARELTRMVYAISGQGRFARDLRLVSQIQAAAVSVMSNVAEGFDSGSDAVFIRFLCYARRSASEVQSQLYVAKDAGYIDAQTFQNLYDKATDVKKLINAFIRYLRQKDKEDQANDENAQPAKDKEAKDTHPIAKNKRSPTNNQRPMPNNQ